MPAGKKSIKSTSDDSLTLDNTAIPKLELDDDFEMGNMHSETLEEDPEEREGNGGEGGEGSESHYGPFRGRDSRTLYHQPRSDQDTL